MPNYLKTPMRRFSLSRLVKKGAVILALTLAFQTPSFASGDLLVAPTRVILDSRRGAEVILSNIGNEEATYRVSLELRRMTDIGKLEDIEAELASEQEGKALSLIRYAPRRVTLLPNQPQSIRIKPIIPADLEDGEYRAHMLFRAIPKTESATDVASDDTGLQIRLIPVYGITIPIIVRKGVLEATAAIANARVVTDEGGSSFQFDLTRKGNRSVYGEVYVTRPGVKEAILIAKGIAIYPEVEERLVRIPIDPEMISSYKGEVIVSYYEAADAGGELISQIRTVIQ